MTILAVFNNHNFHAGTRTVRQTPFHRRSLGFDYGHAELTPPEHGADRFEPRFAARHPALLNQYSEHYRLQREARL